MKIADPHRIHREARYERTEVDQLVSEKKSHPTGMRPTEVANKLGLSVQSVYKYIQEGVIKAEDVPFGDERTIYVVSEAAYEEAAGLLKPSESKRPKRFEYYHSSQISSYFRNSIQARYLKHVLYGIRTANGVFTKPIFKNGCHLMKG
ncbi:hypothetical protein [Peribacillus frigoritolerans]|uniref:hypothetical protein n=1 Tax=Peribacillus frigoritolerans TaxID=450367 RepID=UPI00380FB2F7